ncbi:hypothetical protein [Actinomyces sp. zg328]|nr:hypothetical protein [Actinomyces sp. zg328]
MVGGSPDGLRDWWLEKRKYLRMVRKVLIGAVSVVVVLVLAVVGVMW